MKMDAYVMIAAAFVLGAGCVHADEVSSRTYYETAMRHVRYRAVFDLECPRDQIEVACIDLSPQALERGVVCFVAGARGCGRRASYRTVVVTDIGWNRRLVTWALEGVWSSGSRGFTAEETRHAGVAP